MPKNISVQEEIINKLVSLKLLSNQQLEELKDKASKTNENIINLLVKKNVVSSVDIAKVRGKVLNIPFIDLSDEDIKPEYANIISQELAENYKIIPFDKKQNELKVGMVNPNDYKAVEALDFIALKNNLKIKYYIISDDDFRSVILKYENLSKKVRDVLAKTGEEDTLTKETESKKVEEVYKTAPISKMVSVILRHAVEGEASDVHIEPVADQTRVRFRLDGQLHTSIVLPNNVHSAIIARIKVLSNLKLDETRIPQDGRFRMNFEGKKVDFRVSTLPLAENEKVTIRILDSEDSELSLVDLGFMGRSLELINKYIKYPHGMILVTGPTGSGKTTTLYSILSLLNKESVNIVTLEDPIEYYLPGISQSQINPKTGFSFANGLRSILRQDPDIIMVGEIRDNETAELSIHASLTGHKVLSTLHTNNAFGTIPRMIDMGIEPFLISSSLKISLAQRLVRKVCMKCRKKIPIKEKIREDVIKKLAEVPPKYLPKEVDLENLKAYKGKGCPHCENSGYHGRTTICEIFEVTPSLEKIINSEKISDKEYVMQDLRSQGMFSMRVDGYIKALMGITTFEEILTATQD